MHEIRTVSYYEWNLVTMNNAEKSTFVQKRFSRIDGYDRNGFRCFPSKVDVKGNLLAYNWDLDGQQLRKIPADRSVWPDKNWKLSEFFHEKRKTWGGWGMLQWSTRYQGKKQYNKQITTVNLPKLYGIVIFVVRALALITFGELWRRDITCIRKTSKHPRKKRD